MASAFVPSSSVSSSNQIVLTIVCLIAAFVILTAICCLIFWRYNSTRDADSTFDITTATRSLPQAPASRAHASEDMTFFGRPCGSASRWRRKDRGSDVERAERGVARKPRSSDSGANSSVNEKSECSSVATLVHVRLPEVAKLSAYDGAAEVFRGR